MDYPVLIFAVSFVTLSLASFSGVTVRRRRLGAPPSERENVGIVMGSTLTLLALIIGFTFSMAIGHYDRRKISEEAEASAIGTELLRADLLRPAEAAQVRALLNRYLNQRILFYQLPRGSSLEKDYTLTDKAQNELWSAVMPSAAPAQPTLAPWPILGMNDVLNSLGNTQAAWWDRIPFAAWCLMFMIAIFGNFMLGYFLHSPSTKGVIYLILPLILSIAFYFIADIDSPRGGLIQVHPQNLLRLSQSTHP